MALCSGRRSALQGVLQSFPSNCTFELPVFLCPGFHQVSYSRQPRARRRRPSASVNTSLVAGYGVQHTRILHTHIPRSLSAVPSSLPPPRPQLRLPAQCPGCGALSQTTDNLEAGYYTLTRRTVRENLKGSDTNQDATVIENTLRNLNDNLLLKSLNLESTTASPPNSNTEPQPQASIFCDRCHQLQHHHTGVSIHHPTIDAIADTISETPHKYNHVYHVIDAADFPMSLIPGIHKLLSLTPQRSRNRRSTTDKFYHGRKTEISFIVTRSDLLAPMKAQVDRLMPYLTDVLRDALGKQGRDVRLGNVRCVSAKRSWWTKELKEDVWVRGGGGWMVGRVNVGKSQLFETIFPKGRRTQSHDRTLDVHKPSDDLANLTLQETTAETEEFAPDSGQDTLNVNLLLPPAQRETDYPTMPLVSSLPGTTASPIRIPFGNGKGELIDLPGLARGDLETFVQSDHRASLVMKSRAVPEQQVIKPNQSLLLGGGLIRITPTTPDLVFLAYSFMPIESHLTSTDKAIAMQARERESGVECIADLDATAKMSSAGKFQLRWDVTRQRTGPLTTKSAANLRPGTLPFIVYSADILIEGCGWVELVAQVRRRWLRDTSANTTSDLDSGRSESGNENANVVSQPFPEVEIFSPEGRFVGLRRPMGAWLLNKPLSLSRVKGRPRKSMKGQKKLEKERVRSAS